MATPFEKPIQRFLKRIETDRTFFNYHGLTPNESKIIVEQRATDFLYEAIDILEIKINSILGKTTEIFNYNSGSQEFIEDLTNSEILLIYCYMYEVYLDRCIAKLKDYMVNYTPTELRVFDPSSARETFLKIYERVCTENEHFLEGYKNKNRFTGELIGIDYTSYNSDD